MKQCRGFIPLIPMDSGPRLGEFFGVFKGRKKGSTGSGWDCTVVTCKSRVESGYSNLELGMDGQDSWLLPYPVTR